MCTIFAFILLSQVAIENPATKADDLWQEIPLTAVSKIELPTEILNGDWKKSEGLRIDDLTNLEDVPAEQRKMVRALAKQLSPIGVLSAADFTLVSTGFPLNTVTVRVFVFQTPKQCSAWWKKKYEYDGWREHYDLVDSKSAVAVSSLQMNKTAFGFGNVWLTTHQLGKGDEHITAANHVLKILTNGKRSLKSEKPVAE